MRHRRQNSSSERADQPRRDVWATTVAGPLVGLQKPPSHGTWPEDEVQVS